MYSPKPATQLLAVALVCFTASSVLAIPQAAASDTSSPEDTKNITDATAANYLAAAGIPLWTDPNSAPDDGTALTARDFGKTYELYCTGANMGGFMRTCGNAPPLTGYLCQANCHCTGAGCIKCENKGLGDCSLSVFQATCRAPNVNFACACRVHGTDHSDGLAQMCNKDY